MFCIVFNYLKLVLENSVCYDSPSKLIYVNFGTLKMSGSGRQRNRKAQAYM